MNGRVAEASKVVRRRAVSAKYRTHRLRARRLQPTLGKFTHCSTTAITITIMFLPIVQSVTRRFPVAGSLSRLSHQTIRFASSKSLTDPGSEQNQDARLSDAEPRGIGLPEHIDPERLVDHGTSCVLCARMCN